MPQPRFILSESEIGAPGVYVQEQAPASPIRGQRRRVAGFVGQCVRGPVDRAVKITGYKRFLDVFGGRDKGANGGTILGHVWKALQSKRWGSFWVVRAAAAAAVAASFTYESAAGGAGTQLLRVDAANAGTWGNDVKAKILTATNGDANYFNLAVSLYGVVKLYQNITIQTGLDNTAVVLGTDDANLVKLTKLASGRPVSSAAAVDGADSNGYITLGQTVAGFTSVLGTDGSIADTDYTATNRAIDALNNTRGVHACGVVGRSNSALKTKIAAIIKNQKVWYVCPTDETISIATATTERATLSSDKISYWFNHVTFSDPITGETIYEEPFVGVMQMITQSDPDAHPGDSDYSQLWNYVIGVYGALSDSDRDALDLAGISYMNQDLDDKGNTVFVPGNALTCDFAVNNRDLDGRYMKDFILDAIAGRLRGDQFKGNTKENRARRASSVAGFLTTLARNGRYIQKDEDTGKPQFSYKNDKSVNSDADVQAGKQTDKLIAQLIPKNKIILLNVEIGVDATVSEV